MKAVKEMSQPELAAHVQATLGQKGVAVVLSGGATVSTYSGNQYVSKDLDLVIIGAPALFPLRDLRPELLVQAESCLLEFPTVVGVATSRIPSMTASNWSMNLLSR
ncbi:MAG: hypothetical protein MUO23_05045 [Anaerolineales bacterium]|nr:hypothetical protein [Anaerolineales bacterium]